MRELNVEGLRLHNCMAGKERKTGGTSNHKHLPSSANSLMTEVAAWQENDLGVVRSTCTHLLLAPFFVLRSSS